LNFRKILIVCLVLFLLTGGCEIPSEDVNPPSSPEMVGKSFPYDFLEKGIDAEYYDGQHQIKIEWNRVSDIDLKGYRIYRSDGISRDSISILEPQNFQRIGIIDLPHFPDTVFYDSEPGLEYNLLKTFFYFIRSVDNADNLSDPSDTVSYMLMNPPVPVSPIESDTSGSSSPVPTFVWEPTFTIHDWVVPTYFAIRLQDLSNSVNIQTIWTCLLYKFWPGGAETITIDYFTDENNIPDEVEYFMFDTTYSDELPPGLYRWKVKGIDDIVEGDYSLMDVSSGESGWKIFEVE